MLSLFKKKPTYTPGKGYFPIATDMHSHILPGIDDGSPDIETSIELIKGLMELGIKRSVATPHIISDMYRNDESTINAALKLLKNELEKQQIDFEVSAAAEYMMDAYFFDLLSEKKKMLTIYDNFILTEFSYATMPNSPEKMSFSVITEGYRPILAHPERYPYYYSNFKMYHHLEELGFLLQVNLLSFTGYYGKEAAKASQYMLKHNLISYLGTDLHHDRHMDAFKMAVATDVYKKVFADMPDKRWNDF